MGKKWAEWEVQSSDLKSESESNHIWAAHSNKRYILLKKGESGACIISRTVLL